MKKLNQSGAVALLTVVIFATIVTVVIAAYIHSAITQQSEASNYDYSTRAYYSAESGAQDALRAINSNPALLAANRSTCAPLLDTSTPSANGQLGMGLAYTCQLISPLQGSASGDVAPTSKNVIIKLQPQSVPPTNPNHQLIIRWSPQNDATHTTVLFPRGGSSKVLTPQDRWNAFDDPGQPIHGVLRLSILKVNKADASDVSQQVVFLNPTKPAFEETTVALNGSAQQDPSTVFNNAACYASDGNSGSIPPSYNSQSNGKYACKASLRLQNYDLNAYDIYVRVGSIYRSTEFDLELNTGTAPVTLAGTRVGVDVTGVSGGVYQRVKQTFSIGDGYTEDSWPDAAVVAGKGICKYFTVGTQAGQYVAGCDPRL